MTMTMVLAQAGDAPATAAAVNSVWDFLIKGGVVMIPIGLCSLVAVSVMIERSVSLRRARIIPRPLLDGVRAALAASRRPDAAVALCRQDGSPLGELLASGLSRIEGPVATMEKHVQDTGERVIFRLRRFLRSLSIVASLAPLLGLLGTIFGMIKAFQTVAVAGEALGKTELLARGIYEALITTAAGLIVAIPALLGHHALSARVDHLIHELDAITTDFLEEARQPRTPDAVAAPLAVASDASDNGLFPAVAAASV